MESAAEGLSSEDYALCRDVLFAKEVYILYFWKQQSMNLDNAWAQGT